MKYIIFLILLIGISATDIPTRLVIGSDSALYSMEGNGNKNFMSQLPIVVENPTIVSTTSSVGQDIINEDIIIPSDGNYLVEITFWVNSNSQASDVVVTGEFDGANLAQNSNELLREEFKDTAGDFDVTLSSQKNLNI